MRHTIDHLLIGDRLTRLMAERGLCAADVARMLDGGKGNWSAASVRKWMIDESQPSATASGHLKETFYASFKTRGMLEILLWRVRLCMACEQVGMRRRQPQRVSFAYRLGLSLS